MRNKLALLFLIGMVVVVAGSRVRSTSRQQRLAELEASPDRDSLSWHAEVAKAKGEKRVSIPAPAVEPLDMSYTLDDALAENSAVIAEPIESVTKADGTDFVVSWYKFKAIDYLSRRSIPSGLNCSRAEAPRDLLPLQQDEFVVARFGGTLTINDVLIKMYNAKFPPFELHRRYLLLVSQCPSGVGVLCGGPVGVFKVNNDDALESVGQQFHPITQAMKTQFGSSVHFLRDHLSHA